MFSMALFQTCSTEGKITEGEAFLYRNGGVGVFGEVGVENAVVRPNKWCRVVITLGPSPYSTCSGSSHRALRPCS